MANLRLFAIFIVTAVWCVTIIDTAAVQSEKLVEELQRIALKANHDHLRIQRGLGNLGGDGEKYICHDNTPCGYFIYRPITRKLTTYMSTLCECPDETYRCIRTDDDLSASAYVHRCRQNTTEQDIGPPEEYDY